MLQVAAPPSTHDSVKSEQRQRQILWTFNKAALFRVHKDSRKPGLVEQMQEFRFLLRPLMRIAATLSDHAGHGTTGHAAGGLDEHLEVKSVRKAPHDLAHVVTR